MQRERVRTIAIALLAALAVAAGLGALMPKKYAASARILMPPQAGDIAPLASLAASQDISVSTRGSSRVALVSYVSDDPRTAASVVNDFVAAHARNPMVVVDRASVPRRPVSPDFATVLAYGAAAGLAIGLGLVGLRRERAAPEVPAPSRMAPGEAEASGTVVSEPKEDYRELCSRLLAEWFVSHPILAIVGTGPREARAQVAARLAVCFAELGAKTLLADAELPDPPANVQIKPVPAFEGLFLLLAPRERLAAVVAEAGRRYRVVLIDSPAGEHRFASLAGAALVVARPGEDPALAQALEASLARLNVQVAGKVLSRP
ncbi:MAG TPA: hypothetical protein VHL85_06465 [Burkholderiales bacterium]|jgi:hypothetical protein|nr:hypothetical protein [Burkholderiales bacterium]